MSQNVTCVEYRCDGGTEAQLSEIYNLFSYIFYFFQENEMRSISATASNILLLENIILNSGI
jgi:hypothetical protein